jgi:hypothetical protein
MRMQIRVWIWDPGIFLTLYPRSRMEKNRIRDKHPGSATLLVSLITVPVLIRPALLLGSAHDSISQLCGRLRHLCLRPLPGSRSARRISPAGARGQPPHPRLLPIGQPSAWDLAPIGRRDSRRTGDFRGRFLRCGRSGRGPPVPVGSGRWPAVYI